MCKIAGLILAVALLIGSFAPDPGLAAQQPPAGKGIGVVTALQGEAVVGRVALPQPTPLRFKDDVFFRDVISTREKATVRLLLGGKGTLTIREQSQVTLDESVASDGARSSILGLISGKIAAAVSRALMSRGETVEVRTPNAVAAVRGTVLIAEYIPATTSAEGPKPILLASTDARTFMAQAVGGAGAGQSNFLVLQGNVLVSVQGQPPVSLGPMQSVSVQVTPGGVTQVGSVQTVTPQQASQAAQGLQTQKQHTGEANSNKTAQGQTQQATAVATTIVSAVTGESATGGGTASQQEGGTGNGDATLDSAAQGTVEGTTNSLTGGTTTGGGDITQLITMGTTVNNTVADITPTTLSTENVLPAGPLITLTGSTTVASGVSLVTFGKGVVNSVTAATNPTSPVTSPVIAATGTTITHSGTLVDLGAGSSLSGSGSTPFLSVTGTSFTNGSTLFSLASGSSISGPTLVSVSEGGTLTLSGSVLSSTGGNITLNAPVITFLGASTLNLTGGAAFVLNGGSLTATGGIGWSDETGNTITVNGILLDATDATITFNASTTTTEGTVDTVRLDPGSGNPQIRLVRSSYTDHDPRASVIDLPESTTTTTYAGLFLSSTNSTITMDGYDTDSYGMVRYGTLLGLCCGRELTTSESANPLILITRTVTSSDADVLTYGPVLGIGGGHLTVASTLLSAVGTLGAPVRLTSVYGPLMGLNWSTENGTKYYANLTGTTSGPLLNLEYAVVNSVGAVVGLSTGTQASLAGPLLNARMSSFTITPASASTNIGFLLVAAGATMQMTGSSLPLITLDGGKVEYCFNAGADSVFIGLGSNPGSTSDALATINVSGSLLKAVGTTFGNIGASTLPYTFFGLSHANLTTGGPLLDLENVALNLTTAKPVLYLANGSTLTVGAGPVFRLVGGSLTASALIATDSNSNSIALNGTLLELRNATATLANLFSFASGGLSSFDIALDTPLINVINTATVTSPALLLTGSSAMFSMAGAAVDSDGVGTYRPFHGTASSTTPLQAPLLNVEGVAPSTSYSEGYPDVRMTGTSGKLVILDKMLLESSAAVVKAVGGGIVVENGTDGAMIFNQSRVTITPPTDGGAIWLNNGLLKVVNGPLFSVTGGTQMTINGDFAYLTNGSKILVSNGPLILVDGTNSANPAKPTTLYITGGLLNFGTSSGNTVIINNSITQNGSFTSNSVTVPYQASGGATINAGTNAIKNPGSNTISITGSAIQATNGAKIGINTTP